jgi:hypothetical protein
MKNIKNQKRGVAMFVVIFVMSIIGLLAVNFFRMSRNAQASAFRFKASEVARQIASSAADEAFTYIHNITEDHKTNLAQMFIRRESIVDMTSGGYSNRDSTGEIIPVSLVLNQIPNFLTVEVKARIIDFRSVDSTGSGKYYGNEGVGTLEIEVKVRPKSKLSFYEQGTCTLIRHHDYKVVAMVAARDNDDQRDSYVNSYALDYALFLRDGVKEFELTRGLSLNPPDNRIVNIEQGDETNPNTFGKVYFGTKTNTSADDLVFLNIDSQRKHLLPEKIEDNLFRVTGDQIDVIIPGFQSKLSSQANKDAKSAGAKSGSASMSKHEGQFSYIREPITDEYVKNEKYLAECRDYIMYMQEIATTDSTALGEIYEPAIRILPETALDKIIEGDVRQRYFHFGRFYVDMSKATVDIKVKYKKRFKTKTHRETRAVAEDQSTVDEAMSNYLISYDPKVDEVFRQRVGIADDGAVNYNSIANTLRQNPNSISKIELRYPYKQNLKDGDFQSNITQPKLFRSREVTPITEPSSTSVPFAHVNLWSRRDLTIDQLVELGIYNPTTKKLKLRGVIQLREDQALTLGKDGDIEYEGVGAIVAPSITITNALKASTAKESILILVTRGQPITINTSKKVEASLISMGLSNKNGYIAALQPLNLYGSIAADRFNLGAWQPNASHKIVYNPNLKRSTDLYQINFSRWTTFERIVEQ